METQRCPVVIKFDDNSQAITLFISIEMKYFLAKLLNTNKIL